MKTLLQILFGLVLGVVGMVVLLYLGMLLNGPPGWNTAVFVIFLLAVTQYLAHWAVRRRVAVQVFFGVVLCMAIAVWLMYSSVPMFWEGKTAQPGVYSITWRSGLCFFLLLAATQGISSLLFRAVSQHRTTND